MCIVENKNIKFAVSMATTKKIVIFQENNKNYHSSVTFQAINTKSVSNEPDWIVQQISITDMQIILFAYYLIMKTCLFCPFLYNFRRFSFFFICRKLIFNTDHKETHFLIGWIPFFQKMCIVANKNIKFDVSMTNTRNCDFSRK